MLMATALSVGQCCAIVTRLHFVPAENAKTFMSVTAPHPFAGYSPDLILMSRFILNVFSLSVRRVLSSCAESRAVQGGVGVKLLIEAASDSVHEKTNQTRAFAGFTFYKSIPSEGEQGKGVFGAGRVFPVELLVQQHCSMFILDTFKVIQAAIVHTQKFLLKNRYSLKIAYYLQPFMSVLDYHLMLGNNEVIAVFNPKITLYTLSCIIARLRNVL